MKSLKIVISIALLAVISVSLYNISKTGSENSYYDNMMLTTAEYKPVVTAAPQDVNADTAADAAKESAAAEETAVAAANSGIIEAKKVNPEVVGWVCISNTGVDNIFVKSQDNSKYLKNSWLGKRASCGSLFMDFRNDSELSDFNSIIYGHNMKNGTMFHDLVNFKKREYFDANTSGFVFLENKTYSFEIFAFLNISGNDQTVYTPCTDEKDRSYFLNYVHDASIYYRDIAATEADRYLVLSTCSYEFRNARSVVVAKLSEIQ